MSVTAVSLNLVRVWMIGRGSLCITEVTRVHVGCAEIQAHTKQGNMVTIMSTVDFFGPHKMI